MKIKLVFDGLDTGGIERVGLNYARLMQSHGDDVTITNLRPDKQEMKSKIEQGIRYEEFRLSRKECPEQYSQLIKKSILLRAVIVPIQILLMLHLFIRKTIYSLRHGESYDVVIAFSGHFNDLTYVGNQFAHSKKRFAWVHGAVYSYALISPGFINLYRRIKQLIVLVDTGYEELQTYEDLTGVSPHQLYNPASGSLGQINVANRDELKSQFGKYLLVVDRFDYPYKDHYTIIKALEIIHREKNLRIHLVCVGDGPELASVKEWLRTRYPDLINYVHFVGNQENVQDYYASATLLVHACAAAEGLPTVMLEALDYSLPIVATDAAVGASDILDNQTCGLLCTMKNPRDMSNKIVKLWNDSELYLRIQSAQALRKDDFSPSVVGKKFYEIVNNCEEN